MARETEVSPSDIEEAIENLLVLMGTSDDRSETGPGRAYLEVLAPDGWMVPTWPTEFGGRDADKKEAATIRRILSVRSQPDLYPFFVGLHLVGPTLLRHGSPEQRQRFLPSIASGAEVWCQLFSEPDAGSDLANVGTRGLQTDNVWTLNGQKTWTSRGHYADWGICLARTNPDLPKHAGLTAFAVPMSAPGIEVRPIGPNERGLAF